MKTRVVYVERRPSSSVSIERVFRQVAKNLSGDEFEPTFDAAPHGNGLAAVGKNLLFFRPAPADVYHITGDIHYMSLILPPAKTILTIHDLIFLHRRTGLRRFALKKLYLDLPLRRLRYLTVVSQTIKDEILRLADISPDRIHVIENPLLDGFADQDPKPFEQARPVVLHIGTATNKNLEGLVDAVRGSAFKLRIVGHLNEPTVAYLKGVDHENVTDLDQAEMIEEYRNADIVSFCSTYEGFGLPIIEAQAMGKPVVTSDVPPMNYVSGGAAMLVNPIVPSSIRSALERITTDAAYRTSLVSAGYENVKRFQAPRVAQRYGELYRLVLAESGEIR